MDSGTLRYWILAAGVLLIIFIVKNFIVSKIRLFTLGSKLPGPKAWPIIGNGVEFAMPNLDILNTINKYNQQYGLVRFWWGPDLTVFVCTAEDAEIYFTANSLLDRSKHFDYWKTFVGEGLLTASGHHWKKAKKLMEPAFRYSALRSFLPVFQEKTDVLVDLLAKEVGKPVFEVFHFIKNCTFDIMTKALANLNLNAQTEGLEILKNVDVMMMYLTARMYSVWQQNDFLYGFTETGKDFFTRGKNVKEFIAEVITAKKKLVNEYKRTYKGKDGEEYFAKLTFAERLIAQEEWSDKELSDHLVTILAAGFETSASSICFLLVLLGIHQDVQEKLYQEIKSASALQNEPLNDKDLAKLDYLDKVIKESLRIFPVVPFSLRKANEDIQFGKHLIPKGAAVGINIFAIHRDPKNYKNPNVFDPEHFSKENIANRHPYAFLPFGMGARRCIGEKFAWMAARIIIAKILLNYKVECDMKLKEIPMMLAITLKMTNGSPIRLLKRPSIN